MENLNATPAVEQSEPVSQAETAAAISVAPVASTDENAQAEAAELPQSDASAPAAPSLIQQTSERLAGAEAQPLDPSSVIMCGFEDCPLTDAGHRMVDEAVQLIGERAEETISSVLRQDASDTGEAHEHELARMVDEGGPCPERSLQPGFYRRNRVVADHPFQSFPNPEDPLAQTCHVEGCKLSYLGHPEPDYFGQRTGLSEKLGLSEEAKGQLRTIADEFENVAAEAEVKGDTQNFEERLAKVEEDLAQLRKITEHHGLRGPQA